MKIVKFGGTSVGSPEAIGQIIGILNGKDRAGKVPVVVVSALSGVTDSLAAMAGDAVAGNSGYVERIDALSARHLEIAGRFLSGGELDAAGVEIVALIGEFSRVLEGVALLGELSPRTLDLVMSFGERLSAGLLARVLDANGIRAEFLDARKLVKATGDFGGARYLKDETEANIRAFFSGGDGPLRVATGFIASTEEGQTVTLGRGGSDLTAAIFAAALGADEVEIWTDVDGIMSANPRLVKNAFRIEEMLYVEAMEISHFGARVLFPPTVRPALENGIPIIIRNTFNSDCPGTRIVGSSPQAGGFPVKGISSISRVSLVRMQGAGMIGVAGVSARIFGALARRRINVILITQGSSEYSICLALPPADAPVALDALVEEFSREISVGGIDRPVALEGLSVIAVVGAGMKSSSGVAGKFFHALGRNGVNVVAIAQGSSESSISAVIPAQHEAKALNAVHEAFFHSATRSVNLFLVGTGLIGGTLLDQIAAHRAALADREMIRVNLVGAANGRRMIFDAAGLDPLRVRDLPEGEGEPSNPESFVERMTEMNLPNACFCDCTASDEIASLYGRILSASIAVVTPNKRANSGPMESYRRLTGFSHDRGIPYLYETTVCAGLPVISTLRDLHLSGDRIRRIEAVFSGTLSFIFNSFDGSRPFSALVREAKAKGYTEPDPRDDLNAMDAARKALILARECGLSMELADVKVAPILPAACFGAESVDAFFAELERHDADFENRRAMAAAEGKALRYIAVIEDGRANLSIREEGAESPFRSLVDSDNIVVMTTDRYLRLPMAIKGPGAGAQVTAGGVFADILRVARPPV